MSLEKPIPNGCIEHKPTAQSVLFCGWFINLTHIALRTNLSISTLSMIFSGYRQPTLNSAKRISKALNMTLSEFCKGLDTTVGVERPYRNKLKKVG